MVWRCEDRLSHKNCHSASGMDQKAGVGNARQLYIRATITGQAVLCCSFVDLYNVWLIQASVPVDFSACQRNVENAKAPTVCVRASLSAWQSHILLFVQRRTFCNPKAQTGKASADIPHRAGQSSSWTPERCRRKKLKCSPSWVECHANTGHGHFDGTQPTQSLLHLSICAMRRFSLCHSIECVDCLPSFVHTTNQSITTPTWSTSKEGALRHINTLCTGCNILVDFRCARTYRHALTVLLCYWYTVGNATKVMRLRFVFTF